MKARLLLISLIFLPPSGARADDSFYLSENDRVLFSCWTESQRHFAAALETYLVTRFPKLGIEFSYADCGSDFETQIASRPNAILLTPEGPSSTRLERLRNLPAIKITAVDVAAPPEDQRLRVARARELIQAVIERAQDPALKAQLLPGGKAGGAASGLLSAQAVLASWSAPPLVTSVEIDAVSPSVRRSENTTVRELAGGRVVGWSQDDGALPMPLDAGDESIGRATLLSRFLPELDRQPLQVTGLPAWRYRLTIDGEPVATFTREELANGIDLATMRTPMARQAAEVARLVERRQEVLARRARLLRQTPPDRAALDALAVEESELGAEARGKAQPRTRDYELQPIEE